MFIFKDTVFLLILIGMNILTLFASINEKIVENMDTVSTAESASSRNYSESSRNYYALRRQAVVNLPNLGILKGSITHGAWTSKIIYQFLGVQYAESPSDSRRFKAPVPVKPWQGVRSAEEYGRKCPELNDLTEITEADRKKVDLEDCLNMAIYSGDLDGGAPVMVYIHGGGLYLHSAIEYPPNYIMEREVVLVVPQYRLDALGFLCTKTNDIPGNAGLLDVLLALKWIKSNIQHFGGNPDQITLFGQSSGATIVTALAISRSVPSDLFQRVIAQSGSIFSTWAYTLNPVQDARGIARHAGLNPNQTLTSLNRAFMTMDVYDLLKAVNEQHRERLMKGTNSVEARSLIIGGPTNILPDIPQNMISSGQYNKDLAIIAGTVKDDGSYVTADGNYDGGAFLGLATNMYWSKQQILKGDFREYSAGLIDLLGTIAFKAPALELAQANARCNPNKTFLYTFDYRGMHTRFGYGANTSHYPFDGGVHHSDDNIYLFPYPRDVANLNEADTEMAEKFIDLWTSFATTGEPQIKGEALRSGTKFNWPPVTDIVGPYLHIGQDMSVGENYMDEFTIDTRLARMRKPSTIT